jgi:endonuclease YncB( thermonuclease family)
VVAAPRRADLVEATVVGVIDGDTVDVLVGRIQVRVRLNGIDTPEKRQPWGNAAKRALSGMIFARAVEIESFGYDRYDRLIGTIFLGQVDVNARIIEEGHAWAYRRYLRDPHYCELEADARDHRRGLWALAPALRVAPWEWRHGSYPYTDYSRETAQGCIAAMGAQ